MKIRGSLISVLILLALQACADREVLAPISESSGEERPFYVVQDKDTLYSIAWRFDKDYRELAYYNHITDGQKLKVGRKLFLLAKNKQKFNAYKTPTQKQAHHKPQIQQNKLTHQAQVKFKASHKRNSPKHLSKHSWLWPASGQVVALFSPSKHRKGVDIRGRIGSEVYAAKAGRVAYSGNGLSSYGNLIIIKHNGEFLSAYAHNKRNLVQEGQRVQAHQKIADMGSDKRGLGLLHFEIRRAGKPVNPLIYLGSR